MQIFEWNRLSAREQQLALKRPVHSQSPALKAKVGSLIDEVRTHQDRALFELTARYDGVELDKIEVRPEELAQAWQNLNSQTRQALQLAHENIEHFHRQQGNKRIEIQTLPGIRCYRETRAIERVGFYVPGGSAPLPSTVLMLGVPSVIAGNPLRVLCTPPQKDGTVHPVILAAAQLCGISRVYKVGGAQAIAAMAYGTATVPKVDKIFGPGNAWVTEAKIQVAADPEGAAMDMPAGPSEVLVIADETAAAEFVAADLLSQAEHGPDSQVILVCTSQPKVQQILAAIDRQLASLPRRAIAGEVLQHSRSIIVPDLKTALAVSDAYAPEHLILQVQEPETWARLVHNAGSVFLGPWSPESAGDYATGTNHVLPTYGYAKTFSGLCVESFTKQISFQHLSREGLALIAPATETLARIEGLEAHRRAVSIRLQTELSP